MISEDYLDTRIEPGSTFYYCVRFAPVDRRNALRALFVLHQTVLDFANRVNEPGLTTPTLEWWHQELMRTCQGNADHPLTRALAPIAASRPQWVTHFNTLIAGALSSLAPNGPTTARACLRDISRIYGTTCVLAADLLGNADPAFARRLGVGWGLAQTVIRSGLDARRGRVALCPDIMARYGLDVTHIRSLQPGEAFAAVCREQSRAARGWIASAVAGLNAAQRRRQLPLLILTRLTLALLDEYEGDNWPMLNKRIKLTPLRKLWLAWRTRRTLRAGT